MYERILVPLDGSEVAEVALPYAEQLAGKLGSEIMLMSVSRSDEEQEQRGLRSYMQRTVEAIREGAEKHLDKTAGAGTKIESTILAGEPAEEIVDCAEERNVGLIVMATHGRSGIKRWALGSVADKVLRATNRPVVLIRASGPRPDIREKGVLNRALVPLDGSKEGEAVIPYVEELASRLRAEVTLLRVVPVAFHVYVSADAPAQVPYTDEEMEPLRAAAQSYLDKKAEAFREKGIAVKCQVRLDSAAGGITDLATEIDADMVAMSTHGRSGVGRWVFGSVAEKVVHSGNTPVLLVRVPAASAG